jgi:hypothetical protein
MDYVLDYSKTYPKKTVNKFNKMIPFDTLQWFSKMVSSHDFIFATTMPKNPHWYTLKKTWGYGSGSKDFERAVMIIREYGYTEYFYGTAYTLLNCNGYKFWTMGAPLEDTILINTAKLNYTTDYDGFADEYDSIFADEESKTEDGEVLSHLPDLTGLRVLDVGCGTGLLIDYRADEIEPERYVGIDPSTPMLNVFKKKHPKYASRLTCSTFEDCAKGQFDVVVSLYGSCSYIHPDWIGRIKESIFAGGSYYCLFFAKDYEPISCVENEVASSHFKDNEDSMGGKRTEINHFVLRAGKKS